MTKQKKNIALLEADALQNLFDILLKKGYQIQGPSSGDNAIVYRDIKSVEELPVGWTDNQNNGFYRMEKSKKNTFFDYTVGPHSWKKFLHPPERLLWETTRNGRGFSINEPTKSSEKQAFIGVRACELSAIAIQDKVLMEGEHVDSYYKKARQNLFIVAVNCTRAGNTCFCASMKTGPRAERGFDLALTEVTGAKRHYFVIEVGSKTGEDLLKELPHAQAGDEEIDAAEKGIERAVVKMGRKLDALGVTDILYRNFDNPRWEEIAARCLTCGNCTMVCPTCFCINTEDTTSLSGDRAQRWRRWDSCHSVDFSYIHGGSIRGTATSRYRQWMMHKLAYWREQFGSLGCVGCGRCITWCPVGIDITEEAEKMSKG